MDLSRNVWFINRFIVKPKASMGFKKYAILATMVAILPLGACQTMGSNQLKEADKITYAAEAESIIKPYSADLFKALTTGLSTAGAASTLHGCKYISPALIKQYSEDGWTIKRTTTKPRNSLSAPDEWESKVLAQFEKAADAGDNVPDLKYAEVVNGEYRYMQAIAVKPLCMECHGSNLSQSVQQQLKQDYPNDKATGYQVGDLRGAFSLRKKL